MKRNLKQHPILDMQRKCRAYERKTTAAVREIVMPLAAIMSANSAAILAGTAEDIAIEVAAALERAGRYECNLTASRYPDVAAVVAQGRRVAVMYGLGEV